MTKRAKVSAAAFDKPFKVEVPPAPARTEVQEDVASRWASGMPAAEAVAVSPGHVGDEPPADELEIDFGVEQTVSASDATKPVASRLRRAERGEKLTIWLPPDVATELRVACAKPPRVAVSIAIEEAVRSWLTHRK
jgi:hypothetical protein